MNMKKIFMAFIFVILLLSIIGCSSQVDNSDKPVEIGNEVEAAEGSENVVEGLDEVTTELEEIKDLLK